jgi:hypothetical protein
MQEIKDLKTRTDKKEWAQDMLLDGISKVLGYWQENMSDAERELLSVADVNEIHDLMQAQADRVAKLFGYDGAWTS